MNAGPTDKPPTREPSGTVNWVTRCKQNPLMRKIAKVVILVFVFCFLVRDYNLSKPEKYPPRIVDHVMFKKERTWLQKGCVADKLNETVLIPGHTALGHRYVTFDVILPEGWLYQKKEKTRFRCEANGTTFVELID